MDDVPDERYTTTDVMRATEPVVAPVAPETPVPPSEYEERRVVADRADRPGFSFGDSFLGWNVAAFWMLVLTGIVLALLGNAAYNQSGAGTNTGALDLNGLAVAGIAGLLIAQFVAYFLGGLAAGRMARGSGVANGLGVAVWGVVMALLVGALVYWAGTAYNLGYWATFYGVSFGNWTGQVVGVLVGTLIAMFLGAVLGGMLGARPYERAYVDRRERVGTYRRGRPL
ncbi:MAG: hypothetical protein QOE90_490 [Thermoplasmata archaeon]|jgi:hypothetical protein|nr:hypothetical protein [Thermoplasmata archaeon]